MPQLLFTKKIDRSLLKAGLTVPVAQQQALEKTVGAVLKKGSHIKVDIVIAGREYQATFTNVDFSDSLRTVYQIRYAEGSAICKKLNEIFASSLDSASSSAYMEVWDNGDRRLEFRCFPNTVKDNFMDYLGPVDSLNGYQRSYKLVFYKCFFSEMLYAQKVDAALLTKAFHQFYIDRVRYGLLPDKDVDDAIADPLNALPAAVQGLIMRNPFKAIADKGFFRLEYIDGRDMFCIDETLFNLLSKDDLEYIRTVIYMKLALYYNRMNKPPVVY